MQVYIYICWQLELSGNANLRLYQCWFAFTHRSPIKNFASCRLLEKNFASLRLRKNLVELRARLSLLVDKTTFRYSVLTIYYTTIDGRAPSFRPPAPAMGGRGGHGRRPDYPHPHARQGREKKGATNAPVSAHRHPRRGGRGKVGDAVPDPPQRQHAAEEGTPQTFRIIPSASTPRGKRTPWTRRIITSTHATGEGWDAMDAHGSPSAVRAPL